MMKKYIMIVVFKTKKGTLKNQNLVDVNKEAEKVE